MYQRMRTSSGRKYVVRMAEDSKAERILYWAAITVLPFVAAAIAAHTAGTVEVELQGALDLAAAKQAIKEKGYTCTGVKG